MSQITRIIQKSINSKKLFKQIDDYVQEAIYNSGVRWASSIYRDSLVDILEEFMMELADEGKIVQLNIICDERNNRPKDTRRNIFKLKIIFKQRNCLNVSSIEYIIDDSDSIEDEVEDHLYP